MSNRTFYVLMLGLSLAYVSYSYEFSLVTRPNSPFVEKNSFDSS